jgi:hypothetical protein
MIRKRRNDPPPPDGFQVERKLRAGRHPLRRVFPGLDLLPGFRRYRLSPAGRKSLARRTTVHIVPRKGEWMYVAPHRVPKDADERWKPITSRGDCIVVSQEHLRRSPELVLYLDIVHELLHVIQRQKGRELWDETYDYVNRPTELEAYRLDVKEARRLGVPDSFLRRYLKVEWTTPAQHRRLLRNLGVSAPRRR